MLIVERGVDEAVMFDDVIVRVVSVSGNEVRLAVASPNGGPRYREVVLQVAADPSAAQIPVAARGKALES